MADMFDEQEGGGDFDGAFRERAAPKVPPRRRRGAAAGEDDDSSSAGPEPAVKKTGGWADEGTVSQQPMGRRRDAAATETQAVDAPAASKFDDDDDIPVIPDLEENDEDDITLTVAEPGSISNSFLPTNLKLDTGSLPPPQVRPLLRCTGRCLQWRPPPTGLLEHGRVALPGCP